MGVGVFFTENRGWVGTENAFFICFGMSGHDLPPHRLSPYAPQVETPAPSAPGRTAKHRQQRRACQMQGRPPTTGRAPARHARTLDALHRSAHDTRQAAPGRSRRRRGWRVCNHSIMCIVVVLPLAWFNGSNVHNFR